MRQAATSQGRARSPWPWHDDGGGGMAKGNGWWQGSAWVGVGCAHVCARGVLVSQGHGSSPARQHGSGSRPRLGIG
jgi:hypothetical protein